MPCLTDITTAELRELRAAGVLPTDEEIVWLNDLGRKVETPSLRVQVAQGQSVEHGSIKFYPLTIQASQWFNSVACALFRDNQMLLYCLAYAMVHGRMQGHFEHLSTYDSARDAVTKWALRIPFNSRELNAILDAVLNSNPDVHPIPKPKSQQSSDLDLIAELTAGTGQSPEYWLCQSSDRALATIRAIYRQQAAAFGGIHTASEEHERYKAAMWDFMQASEAIRQVHSVVSTGDKLNVE